MTLRFPRIDWLPPWEAATNPSPLELELAREVGPGHPLFGSAVHAFARRTDNDDVAFLVGGDAARVAVVHLTWRGTRERGARWPWTVVFPSVDAWMRECLLADFDDGQPQDAPSAQVMYR